MASEHRERTGNGRGLKPGGRKRAAVLNEQSDADRRAVIGNFFSVLDIDPSADLSVDSLVGVIAHIDRYARAVLTAPDTYSLRQRLHVRLIETALWNTGDFDTEDVPGSWQMIRWLGSTAVSERIETWLVPRERFKYDYDWSELLASLSAMIPASEQAWSDVVNSTYTIEFLQMLFHDRLPITKHAKRMFVTVDVFL